ncbi:MAG TPA: 3-dehydroquinate synthase [Pseudogracilibacillus sp.]|nr:3-dehydroquinate synthase [Pseudogracilibacillus sp.]
MEILNVKTSSHDYNVTIGHGTRFQINELLPNSYSSIMIITDEVIEPLYLSDVKAAFDSKKVFTYVLPSGEAEKSIDNYYKIQTKALEVGLDRNSLLIALGGGVVGDITGFVAATYMRGIDFIQIPTTVLAHDSSVGGKVAINHELGKNMIGAFYPPKAVIYDIDTLKTLNTAELRSGYAELIKEAFISGENFLNELLETKLTDLTDDQLSKHLYQGIKVKAGIVEADEKESNVRKYLNFGHTLSHAIESELGYGEITHGEAVAIGIIFALKLSNAKYKIKLPIDAYVNWLKMNNYPLNIPEMETDKLVKRMKSDKKTTNQVIQMILLKDIGKPHTQEVSDDFLIDYLAEFIKELKNL